MLIISLIIQARRWVVCEFFYSGVDEQLFLGDNEFYTLIKESFPNLKTHLLNRAQWRTIRRLLGKLIDFLFLPNFETNQLQTRKFSILRGFWNIPHNFYCNLKNKGNFNKKFQESPAAALRHFSARSVWVWSTKGWRSARSTRANSSRAETTTSPICRRNCHAHWSLGWGYPF